MVIVIGRKQFGGIGFLCNDFEGVQLVMATQNSERNQKLKLSRTCQAKVCLQSGMKQMKAAKDSCCLSAAQSTHDGQCNHLVPATLLGISSYGDALNPFYVFKQKFSESKATGLVCTLRPRGRGMYDCKRTDVC